MKRNKKYNPKKLSQFLNQKLIIRISCKKNTKTNVGGEMVA